MGALVRLSPEALVDLARRLGAGREIAVVNFHATPLARRDEYARQLALLRARFDAFDAGRFAAVMRGEPGGRPMVIPVLYEGFRDNLDVLVPLLDDAGLPGWIIVPPGFVECPPAQQRAYAEANRLIRPVDAYPGERIAMTWPELADLARRGHVIGCHTMHHAPLVPGMSEAELRREIVEAKALMEARLGRPVDIFCWRRGTPTGADPRADAMLRQAGFRYLLSNLAIEALA